MGLTRSVFGTPCPNANPYTGATCKRRGCPHCGRPWVKSWETVSKLNLGLYGDRLVLISITAPGADRLPWSCGRDHKHAGWKGCRVKDDYADVWASDCTKRLAELRDAARVAVKRAGLPVDSLWLERVWEPQKRGVPHVHLVVGAKTPAEHEAAQLFYEHLKRLARDYNFGEQLHITRPMRGDEAARYLAGYLLGRSRKKGTARDNLADPRMPRSLIYVARRLTRETHVTMRRLRYVRWIFAAVAGRVDVYPKLEGELRLEVAAVCARLDPKRAPPKAWAERIRIMRLVQDERDREVWTPARRAFGAAAA